MQVYVMNSVLNGLSHQEALDGLSRQPGEESPAMDGFYDEAGNYYYWDDEEGLYNENDVVNGLSRIEAMNDYELSEELGKLRIRFGKGKGRRRRKERRALKKEARTLRKQQRKEKRRAKKEARQRRRGKALKGAAAWVKDVAGAIGRGENGRIDPRLQERILATEIEPELKWGERDAFWGMTNMQAVWAGAGTIVVIGGTTWLIRRGRKGRRRGR